MTVSLRSLACSLTCRSPRQCEHHDRDGVSGFTPTSVAPAARPTTRPSCTRPRSPPAAPAAEPRAQTRCGSCSGHRRALTNPRRPRRHPSPFELAPSLQCVLAVSAHASARNMPRGTTTKFTPSRRRQRATRIRTLLNKAGEVSHAVFCQGRLMAPSRAGTRRHREVCT
jgi:hypothetical protein